tara:strand:- start:229 stop:417 length:189 start_codon:yes stop_codon:yes gene_type:complete
MPLEYLFFHKKKLIEIASVAKGWERDAISVFKTKEERDTALNKICRLNNQVEEILNESQNVS